MSPVSSFSQFLLDANEQQRLEFRIRSKWMIRLRWFYIILLPLVAVIAVLSANDSRSYIRTYLLVMVIGIGLNGLLWLTTANKNASLRFYQFGALLQVLLDLILASAVIYAGEGADSRAVALYAIPIIVSGVLFPRPAAYVAAILSSVAYLAVIVIYPLLNNMTSNLRLILSPAIFFPLFFLLLAAIITRFSAINAMSERERTYQQLLSMLRHQLHHPSSVIAALVEMLENSDSREHWSAKDREYLQQLKRENLRYNTMITNILESMSDPSEVPLKHPKKINILELLNETAVSCAMAAKRLGDLKTNLPNETIEFDGQPQQLRTALDNVVENAFRYSDKGTPVTINLKQEKSAGAITITVSDKGSGMTSKQQRQLFRLFTRLEEQGNKPDSEAQQLYSMGLGLYVSKMIIERHNGALVLDSTSDKGTIVTITLHKQLS